MEEVDEVKQIEVGRKVRKVYRWRANRLADYFFFFSLQVIVRARSTDVVEYMLT